MMRFTVYKCYFGIFKFNIKNVTINANYFCIINQNNYEWKTIFLSRREHDLWQMYCVTLRQNNHFVPIIISIETVANIAR